MQQLVSDALNEIWSTPDTSNQYILKPGRITPDGGVMLSYQVLWDKYTLPNNTSTFHLYQIGQIHPTLINLFAAPQGTWELLSDACNNIQMVADVYTDLGLEIPRCRTWYMVTKKRNVLLAVEQNARLNYDFDADAIYLRTYRNAYFQRPEVNGTATLSVAGQIVTSNADIVAMNNAILALPSQTNVYCFVNGYKVGMISMATAVAGDVCEYVYDSSIYKVVDFQITSLHSFLSTKDSSYKYLLHYSTGWDGMIDFIDNIVDGLAKLPDSADQQSSLDAVVTSSVLDSAAVEESTVAAYKAGLKKQTAAIAASEAPASAKQPKKGGDFDPPEGAGPK